MITLGTVDRGIPESAIGDYVKRANRLTGVSDWNRLRGDGADDWRDFRTADPGDIGVAELQGFLRDAGFLPHGRIDGICGYRTAAAIRLFQEYVRSVEGDAGIGMPDGQLGPKSAGHVRRWQAARKRADWVGLDTAASPACARWMAFLQRVRDQRRAHPDRLSDMVQAWAAPSDTVRPAAWDLDPRRIHFVGIRRNAPQAGQQVYDDVFILLVRGLAFRFLGSTDPGHTVHPRGFPFLVPGQHEYRFGWHKQTYHALKPAAGGVLVVRSRDVAFTEEDLASGLERNNTINVHWGGEGLAGVVGKWSEGCQVIAGKGYFNHLGRAIDCTRFAATTSAQLGTRIDGVYQTRGAYTLLADLGAAFSGGTDNTVRYTLLTGDDLALAPDIAREVDETRRALQAIR